MEERNGIIYTAHSEGIYKRRNKLNRTLTSKNLMNRASKRIRRNKRLIFDN